MVNNDFSYTSQMKKFIYDKDNIMDEESKEVQKDTIISLVNIDFNEKYKIMPVNSSCHVINILCKYREKLKEHLDFVYNIIHNKNESRYYPIWPFLNI